MLNYLQCIRLLLSPTDSMGGGVGVRMFSQQSKTHNGSCPAEHMKGYMVSICPFSLVSYWECAGKV